MPGIGSYPCSTCEYVAGNRRMLSRHVAVVHSQKVYRCPLCPFITRYAANWYRHKRGIHGISSKTNTCDLCGFFANSPEHLVQHKELQHQGNLQQSLYGDGYAIGNQGLGPDVYPSGLPTLIGQPPVLNGNVGYQENVCSTPNEEHNSSQNSINDDSFDPEDFLEVGVVAEDDSVTFSLPVNGGYLENDNTSLEVDTKETDSIHEPGSISPDSMDYITNQYNGHLSPLKVRRSYCCDMCGLLTSNPREFLYHQRDSHNMKINVHECDHCIYASKHIQKLQRHFNLVHKNKIGQKSLDGMKIDKNPSTGIQFQSSVNSMNPMLGMQMTQQLMGILPDSQANSRPRRINHPVFKCVSVGCTYKTRDRASLIQHEKTAHMNKKFFRCSQCGYVTNEKGRYTKHMKHHDLPKIQCEFCHFKSAYKWSMDRHMKNHSLNGEGNYNCTICNFITSTQQSLKVHVTNHHPAPSEDSFEGNLDPFLANGSSYQGNAKQPEYIWIGDEFETSPSTSYPSNSSTAAAQTPSNQMENTADEWESEQSIFHCNSCSFQTVWPYELKRHEETHKVSKKHSCPLCGMGFEHIAWLLKHLRRIHKENAEAKGIAAALEQLKPQRWRSAASKMAHAARQASASLSISSYEATMSDQQEYSEPNEPRQSVLSALLKSSTPQRTQSTEFQTRSRQPFSESLDENLVDSDKNKELNKSAKKASPCTECGYKTKWISEMEKHMRVHSSDKPFQCSKCAYHSKWKGDLTRHMMKHHGIKMPAVHRKIPTWRNRGKRIYVRKTLATNRYRSAISRHALSKTASSTERQIAHGEDSPLDLTMGQNEGYINPLYKLMNLTQNNEDAGAVRDDRSSFRSDSKKSKPSYLNMLLSMNSDKIVSDKDNAASSSNTQLKQKYHCPFCSFNTSTASRFHVHIVQHYNKRPFMCSSCGYRSNWEWDITKHIRLRGCKDAEHNNACVLLTDETGRRNYDKYDKYLRSEPITNPKTKKRASIIAGKRKKSTTSVSSDNLHSPTEPYIETPETIVVTPDIQFEEEATENLDEQYDDDMYAQKKEGRKDYKFFMCKHCNFKHNSKKGVISHLSVHAGIRPFSCRVCGLSSNWRHIIVNHIKVIHNGYMNDVEERISYAQEGYVIRITSVVSENQARENNSSNPPANFNCKFCPYKCDKEVYIKFHMKQHKPREGAVYECTFCPYYVKFKKTLMRHMKLHEPTPSVADNDAAWQEQISAAANYSTPQDNFTNYADGENEADDIDGDCIRIAFDQLNAPDPYYEAPVKKTPPKIKRHVCEHCPYRTDNHTQYLYHKQFHRPNSTAPFKCSFCTYWATMQHLLTQHMKIHLQPQENVSSCGQEDEHYSQNSIKRVHKVNMSRDSEQIPIVLVPRGGVMEKMFKCRYCPMTNKKRANVRVHERMHTSSIEIGKYTCSLCNYKCLGQGGLTNHMKIHQSSPEKPNHETGKQKSTMSFSNAQSNVKRKVFSYFCMKCPAVFKSASDLFIHKTFHGASLPFPCNKCDYKAKHRIHLQKHLQVHTDEYISKRDASYGPPVNPELDNATEFLVTGAKAVRSGVKKLDQLLLLEKAEVKSWLNSDRLRRGSNHKCTFCPASFAKAQVHAYHLTMHGSSAQFSCSQCDYATTRQDNLDIHEQLHTTTTNTTKPASPKKFIRGGLQCPKCPAVFNKTDRFERHLGLHGQNARFTCEHCDYSVHYVANLSKHKSVHLKPPAQILNSDTGVDNMSNALTVPSSVVDNSPPMGKGKASAIAEDKKVFMCDRCPYFQGRKDAVQNHQMRHTQKEGYPCPHCDYRSMGSAFLKDHIKSHMQPTNIFRPQVFINYGKFEIWCEEEDTKTLLFQDKGILNDVCNRFIPEVQEREDIIHSKSESKDPKEKANRTPQARMCSDSSRKPGSSKQKKRSAQEDIGRDLKENVGQTLMVPKIVLTDIFSSKHGMSYRKSSKKKHSLKRRNANDEYPKSTKQMKLTSICENSENKSSIIVKIKVEKNILEDSGEQSLYTIATDKSCKSDPMSDAASDVTIPMDDNEDFPATKECVLNPVEEQNQPNMNIDCLETENSSSQLEQDISEQESICIEETTDYTEIQLSEGQMESQPEIDTESQENESSVVRNNQPIDDVKTDPLKELNSLVNGVTDTIQTE